MGEPLPAEEDVISLTRLELRAQDMYLSTCGLDIGTPIAAGPHTGGKVVGLYATPSAFMVELEMPSGEVVTVLHRGDGAGVVSA
jgi:hypothetical protein